MLDEAERIDLAGAGMVGFRSFEESTAQDWQELADPGHALKPAYPDRVLLHLRQLDGDTGGFPVTRLTHCLQTATRAFKAARDEEYVVCALLHDIGDILCPVNHADMASAMIGPYVSEENHWVVANHTVFQGYYYFHHIGLNKHAREIYRGHPYFSATEEFCRLFDQTSFDPAFPTMPLSAFEPMVHRVLQHPKRAISLAPRPKPAVTSPGVIAALRMRLMAAVEGARAKASRPTSA